MASTPARFESSGYLPTTLVRAAPVDDEEALHHRNCPGALNLMVDILGTFYKRTHKLNVVGHMSIWTFLVCGPRAKTLPAFCIYRNIYSMHINRLYNDVKTFYALRPACDRVGTVHIIRTHF
jgi:hypothetical protein